MASLVQAVSVVVWRCASWRKRLQQDEMATDWAYVAILRENRQCGVVSVCLMAGASELRKRMVEQNLQRMEWTWCGGDLHL